MRYLEEIGRREHSWHECQGRYDGYINWNALPSNHSLGHRLLSLRELFVQYSRLSYCLLHPSPLSRVRLHRCTVRCWCRSCAWYWDRSHALGCVSDLLPSFFFFLKRPPSIWWVYAGSGRTYSLILWLNTTASPPVPFDDQMKYYCPGGQFYRYLC